MSSEFTSGFLNLDALSPWRALKVHFYSWFILIVAVLRQWTIVGS